jgi:DNA-directed RNA polymerase sigma subunit (sigma70/sigma32)
MNDDEEMLEIAKSLRREFDELGEVTDVTKKRLKEILEDKTKREKFAEVLTKEEEEVTEMSEIDELGNITDVPKEEQIEDLLTDFLTKRVEFEEVLTKKEEKMDLIRDMLKTLTKREVNVLSKYFGLLDGERETIAEIGEDFDITLDSVIRIKDKGVLKVIHRVNLNIIQMTNIEHFTSIYPKIDKDLMEKCINERKSKDLDEFMMDLIKGKNS